MTIFAVLAEALSYPEPGKIDVLEDMGATLPDGAVKNGFARFLYSVRRLDLGAWEELHTRTLDLNPPAAPYIGYQIWGDSYQRGSFLAMMNRALDTHQVDLAGELPDHIIPVLRFLDKLDQDFPELQKVLEKAVERIRSGLAAAEPENPYIALFDAVSLACASFHAPALRGVE